METVLVTGANAGLGLALVEAFLKSGRRVVAGVRSDSSGVERLMHGAGDRLQILPMDVTDEESVRTAVQKAAQYVESLDVIVNNAGVLDRVSAARPIEELDFKRLAEVMDINAYGALRVLKYSLPLLYKGHRPRVINISSEAGSISACYRKDWYDYCMSKAALNMSSMILQNYLKEKKIKVLAIHPGWMATKLGGFEAPVTPQKTAAGILKIVEKDWEIDGPVFMDFEGKLWQW